MVKQEDIVKPLIFLDIFDYPPTAMEVWRFLGVKAELGEVIKALSINCHFGESASLISRVGVKQIDPGLRRDDAEAGRNDTGFYFLPERDALLEKRREFFHLSEKKFRIAKRAAWFLHFIPSIKMIAVCNNFYYRPQSDIDFFIITAPGRLWLTRFFATIILDIFHLRARGEKTADKVCLSFYLSEDNLNLEDITLKPDDPYFCYWLAFLEPIYGQECYDRFWKANEWLKNIFPNALPKMPVPRRQVGGISSRSAGRDCGMAEKRPLPSLPLVRGGADPQELIARKIQWWKISPRVKELAGLGDKRVVINEAMLKFHENDRREEFREKYKENLKNLF